MEHISNYRVRWASLLATLLICSKSINAVIGLYYKGSFRIGILVLGVVWALYLFHCISFKLYFDKKAAGFIGFILLYFIISVIAIGGYANDLILRFIEYGLLGFLIGQIDFDIEKTTRNICYLMLLFAFPFYQMIQTDLNSYQSVISMTSSYAIMPMAMITIAHCLFFRRRVNVFLVFSYIISFAAMFMLVIHGTRGVILCLLTFLFLTFMNTKRRRTYKYNPSTIAVIILVFILILNVDSLTTMLNNFFTQRGIEINFLQKSAALLEEEEGMSHGRLELYGIAFQGFLSSPIYGNGIGAFGNLKILGYGVYPHNMFLQVLYEGGLLLGIPIIVITVWSVLKALFGKIQDDNKRIAMILLVSCSIPVAMVTDELWNYQILWMLFGFFFRNHFFQKNSQALTQMDNKG